MPFGSRLARGPSLCLALAVLAACSSGTPTKVTPEGGSTSVKHGVTSPKPTNGGATPAQLKASPLDRGEGGDGSVVTSPLPGFTPTPGPTGTAGTDGTASGGATPTPGASGAATPTPDASGAATPTPTPTSANPQPTAGPNGLLTPAQLFNIAVLAGGSIGADKDATGTDAVISYNGSPGAVITDLTGMAFEPGNGAFWFAEQGFYNHLRRVTTGGAVTYPYVSGPGLDELHPMLYPAGLATDTKRGVLYMSDAKYNHVIAITPNGTLTVPATVLAGVTATVVGSTPSSPLPIKDSADGTPTFNHPSGLAVDGDTLYVSDTGNHCIRAIALGGATPVVTTLAGAKGTSGAAVDNVDAATARFNQPEGLAVFGGKLFVCDAANQCIRAIDLTTKQVTIYAGKPGVAGTQDGGSDSATLNLPVALTVDGKGNLYVGEAGGDAHRARRIDPTRIVNTIAGGKDSKTDTTGFGVLLGVLAQSGGDGSLTKLYAYDLGPPTIGSGPGPRIVGITPP